MFPVVTQHVPPARGERIDRPAWPRAARHGPARRRRRRAGVPARGAGDPAHRGRAVRCAARACCRCTGGCRRPSRTRPCAPGPSAGWCWPPRSPSRSLTVPGVRAVVDAGLARVPRMDHRRGLAALVTVPVSAPRSRTSGPAGPAARPPGRVYRCWSAAEPRRWPRTRSRRSRTADLTGFALELACWGTPDGVGLALLGPAAGRPAASPGSRCCARSARWTRTACRPTGAARMADARAAPAAGPGAARRRGRWSATRAAAEVVALLDDDTLAGGRRGRRRAGRAAIRVRRGGAARWRAEVARLRRLPGPRSAERGSRAGTGDPGRAAATVVALAYPERLARARRRRPRGVPDGRRHRRRAPARAARWPAQQWLAVAVADRAPGADHGRIRLAAPADEANWPSWRRRPCCPRTTRWAGSTATCWPAGSAGSARSCSPSTGSPPRIRTRSPRRCGPGCAPRAPGCCAGPTTPAGCGDRLAFCTARARRPLAGRLRRRAAGRAGALVDRPVHARPQPGRPGPDRRGRGAARGCCRGQLAARLDELAPERIEVPSGLADHARLLRRRSRCSR